MDLLLGCLAVLFIGAFVADRLVASRVIVALRSDFAVLTATIRNGEVPDVVLSAHQLFGDYVGKCRSALTQGAASAGGWGTYERSGRG